MKTTRLARQGQARPRATNRARHERQLPDLGWRRDCTNNNSDNNKGVVCQAAVSQLAIRGAPQIEEVSSIERAR